MYESKPLLGVSELFAKLAYSFKSGFAKRPIYAMDVFYEIRSFRDIRKKPSTSELIDWVNALQIGGIPVEKIKKELPFIGVVVKKDEDMETARRGNY